MVLKSDGGSQDRLQARRVYYGKPRYDMLEVTGDAAEPWYGRALAFFDVQVEGEWHHLVLLHWLQPTHQTHVAGAVTFKYWAIRPDVVPLSTIVRRVRMLTSPRQNEDTNDVFFVLLPYGKCAVH